MGKTKKKGTRITFLPSKQIFSSTKFSASILEKRIRELAFLNKGVAIKLIDNTSKKAKEFLHKYDGGILEFVKHINNKKPILVKNQFMLQLLKITSLLNALLSGMQVIQKKSCLLQTIFHKRTEVLTYLVLGQHLPE